MPSGKFWISVSSENNTHIFSKIIFIKTNSVRATWHAHKPDAQWQEHIPAEKITALIKTLPDVSRIYQPFPSFDGRLKESAKNYYTRVAERLKHKNRVITPEDYEKVILDAFPNLFQVKCLTHFSHPEFVNTGIVKIIVVPRLNQATTFYEPRVSYNELEEIEQHVKKIMSPFADLQVINPVFERVRVSCKVRLENDRSTGEFVDRLERDLRQFICPWFANEQGEMRFGGDIEKDDVLSFIESLDYVKFVTKLSIVVLHYNDGEHSLSDSASDAGNMAIASSTPWSVLVPDSEHDIELIDKSISEAPEHTRIETMKIGTNFVITDDEEEEVDLPLFDLDKDVYYSIEIDF
jgi:hypothetical protein